MVNEDTFRQAAGSFPEATEEPHFEKPSFRVRKKIFATLDLKKNLACLKLSLIDQNVFASFDKSIVYPAPGKWGAQGWTLINLRSVPPELMMDALITAYCEVAPEKLSAALRKATG